ncbi:MAG TPA: hypothetical protein VGI32_05690 [Steroidobacteraceae bacterium]|jgi:hypothetical protein
MTIKGKSVLLAVSALGLILAGAGPALAQGHAGGGGGGHASGGHSFGGGHAAVGHVGAGGGHFAGPGHFAGGSHVVAYRGSYGHSAGFVGHTGFAGHGYSTGWRGGSWGGWRGSGWRGGYWHGGFWPRAFYGAGFAWFLPILPLAYATYWYSGVPYYYANDVYYTWNPTYDGYVATDPPPVADSSGSADVGAPPPSDAGADQNYSGPAPQNSGPGPGGPVAGQIFMYPKNGQSAEQQATDRSECQKWASEQAGQVAQNGSDYNRAMVACVEGRGYSAR